MGSSSNERRKGYNKGYRTGRKAGQKSEVHECGRCSGTGKIKDDWGITKTCPTCGGKGKNRV